MLLGGCNMEILSPKGDIGAQEKTLLFTATGLMLLVVIPVIIMILTFAWKYRASNTKADYQPKWAHSTAIEVVVWTVPCIIVAILAVITWRSTHALDPYKPLVSEHKPVTIEVVSLDWKWLFIYPEYDIATVNEIAFPVDVPVNFRITSASVMNSFFIPQLGSQIYSMAGMETKLHLNARARHLRRHLGQLQRRRLLRHALQGHRHVAGRLRQLGQGSQGFRHRADSGGVPGTDQAQRTQPGRQVRLGAAVHVRLHPGQHHVQDGRRR